MKLLVLLGRIFFSWIFVQTIVTHLSGAGVGYATKAGVPLASFLVPFSGFMAFLGGLSIAFGYKAKWGAWLIILFLIPVTFFMHNFWAVTDPMAAKMQYAMFEKNLAMLGGAFLIAYFGAGPLSIDSLIKTSTIRHERRSERVEPLPGIRGIRSEKQKQNKEKEKS